MKHVLVSAVEDIGSNPAISSNSANDSELAESLGSCYEQVSRATSSLGSIRISLIADLHPQSTNISESEYLDNASSSLLVILIEDSSSKGCLL